MNPALISTIMAPNFEIKEITSGTRRSIPIPNLLMSRGPRGKSIQCCPTYQRQKSTGRAQVKKDARRAPGALTFPLNAPPLNGVFTAVLAAAAAAEASAGKQKITHA